MSGQAAGGALLLLIAIALGYLWINGFLSSWISQATGAVASPPQKNVGAVSRFLGTAGTGGSRTLPGGKVAT